ncbi:type II and III secretion system protein family protein [Pelagibius sp. CAU 1746]|uniref:type II and III secretion system protein family protein n=1 Tax=Pelagibius sp. CAU 1746 TaxID=3140370 RepID=UPI00325AF3BD
MRMISRLWLAAAIVLSASLLPLPGQAALQGRAVPTNGDPIAIEIGEGQLLRLDRGMASVFIANPGIADVSAKSDRLLYLFGKAVGTTTLFALDSNDNVIANIQVNVTHSLKRLQSALTDLVPNGTVVASSVDGAIILSGAVETATESENARRLASRFVGEGGEVINRLAVTAPNQVNLRVRIAEVSREVINQFGFNWDILYDGAFQFGLQSFPPVAGVNAIFGGGNIGDVSIDGLLDVLADDNLVSILAEPNLTAVSGETASFLAGGEFPIPVSQDEDTITVVFKQFGVSLAFTPTLLGRSRVSMRVRPEVSQLSTAVQVVAGGLSIPSLTTRRAETTVELASGQSFAIAGLILDNTRQENHKIPGLSDLPILGALFQSDRFQRNETELVIIVTPYIVRPVDAEQLRTPVDPYRAAPLAKNDKGPTRRTVPVDPAQASSLGGAQKNTGFILD